MRAVLNRDDRQSSSSPLSPSASPIDKLKLAKLQPAGAARTNRILLRLRRLSSKYIRHNITMTLESIVVIGIIGNVFSTVGVVLTNKYLWSHYDFHFMILLSCLHFISTSIATRILLRLGFFQYKAASFQNVLPVAVGSLGSVAFMNLNLAYNSVGFYQISKLMCIPVTLALQFLMFRKEASSATRWALAVILSGVGLATVFDVSINFVGLVFATLAVVFTALGQIFTGSKQKELGLDAMQLLYHVSPLIATGMFLLIAVFDDTQKLRSYVVTAPAMWTVLLTCLLAIGVNMSNYLVIGKTSPVTYQVVGHSKTCLILVLGFVFFESPVTPQIVIGVIIAVGGVVWYGEIKRHESSHLPVYTPVKPDAKERELSPRTPANKPAGSSV